MSSPQKQRWLWTPQGLVEPHVELRANGPLLATYLRVFSAKLAMALYREHVGEALPLTGAVYTKHFLNAGLERDEAEAHLSILPITGRLVQGSKTSSGQFEYRYNCDNKTIVAALVSLHHNLHVVLFASSDPHTYKGLADIPYLRVTTPGTLVAALSSEQRASGLASL